MNAYWVEVKKIGDQEYWKGKIIGLREGTDTSKLDCVYGGDACLPISEKEYNLLRVFQGNLEEALETITALQKYLIGDNNEN
jgi:hypothetical protein